MDPAPETPTPQEKPAVVPVPVPVPAVSGEGVAENYIAIELQKAREALRRTQIGAIIVLAILVLYMGYMTARVVNYAQPQAAAEVASGLVAGRVNDQATELSEKFKEQIPKVMASLPDEAIKRMPEVREGLTAQIEGDLKTYCKDTSDDLSKHLDTFLTSHKDRIKTVFEAGQDREAVRAMGPDLEKELMLYIQAAPEAGGDSIKTKIDQALTVLTEMKKKTDRLASTPPAQLTTEERKTKRAIALISRTISKELSGFDLKQAVGEHLNPAIDAATNPGTVQPGAPALPDLKKAVAEHVTPAINAAVNPDNAPPAESAAPKKP